MFIHGYNYGLVYMAYVLKNSGHCVKFIPIWNSNDLKIFYQEIEDEKPGIVVFSVTSSQFFILKDITNAIKGF